MTDTIQRPVQFFSDTVECGTGMRRSGRAKFGVTFSEAPPEHVIAELRNNLGWQYEEQYYGRTLKWWCSSSHVPEGKYKLAKMALHRAGYERHDDLFMDQENADECFGCRQPGHPNFI